MSTPKLCKNPDGRAYATIPKSGRRRKYFGTYGTPEAESAYRRWLGQLLRLEEQPEPLPIVDSSTRIADLVEPFLDHAAGYYSRGGKPTEEFRNLRDTMRLLLRHARNDLAVSFGPNALREVRDKIAREGWVDQKGESRRYSRRYLNSTTGRILRFFTWCESRELVPKGTSTHLRTVEPLREGSCKYADERPKVQAVPLSVVRDTLPFCRDNLAALIQVQLWGGMRPSEACRMRPVDIDTSGDIWLYTPDRHKTEHHEHRLVKAIPTPAQEAIAPFLEAAPTRESPLFTTRYGNPYDARSYYQAVKKAVELANKNGVSVPHWSPLQLRHTISGVVDKMLGREASQHYLGHSRPDVTAIYAGRNESLLLRAAESLSSSPHLLSGQ